MTSLTESKDKKTLQVIALGLISIILTAVFMFLWLPGPVKGYLYEIFLGLSRLNAIVGTWNWESLESEHFIIRYKENEEENAFLVAEAAEYSYKPLADKYELSINEKIPVIVYSKRQELNAHFGWPANERAMGVYWGGVIRILSPDEWINYTREEEKKEIFFSEGPMAHELTHLIIDHKSKGNYPRWFTEGLAQYEEYRITGYQMVGTRKSLAGENYSLQELEENFDSLADQSLAYHQSLSMIEYIVEFYGEDVLHKIIEELSAGSSFGKVLEDELQINLKQFEKSWLLWVTKIEGHHRMTLNF